MAKIILYLIAFIGALFFGIAIYSGIIYFFVLLKSILRNQTPLNLEKIIFDSARWEETESVFSSLKAIHAIGYTISVLSALFIILNNSIEDSQKLLFFIPIRIAVVCFIIIAIVETFKNSSSFIEALGKTSKAILKVVTIILMFIAPLVGLYLFDKLFKHFSGINDVEMKENFFLVILLALLLIWFISRKIFNFFKKPDPPEKESLKVIPQNVPSKSEPQQQKPPANESLTANKATNMPRTLSANKYKVLLLSDETTNALKDSLEANGYEVNNIKSHGDFKNIFSELLRQDYDMLIPTNSDLLPKDILQLVHFINEKFPKINIWVISGWQTRDFISALKRLKVNGISPFPINPNEFIEKINELFNIKTKNKIKLDVVQKDIEKTYNAQVLIVDDEEQFLLSVAEGLRVYKKYFNIRTAPNGAEAVKVLKLSPIDLVITDLSMPKMDGFELLAYMNRNYPKIPVILMTAYGTPKIEEIVMSMGVFRYMEKPLDINAIADSIFDALGIKISPTPKKMQKTDSPYKPAATLDQQNKAKTKAKMVISDNQRKNILEYVDSADNLVKGLYNPAILFANEERYSEAIFCLRELLERSTDMQEKVNCLYTLGQIMEQMDEFENAIIYYQEAAKICTATSDIAYGINNNIGFSLCMLARFVEAEKFCRLAIKIDTNRSNAFKNLGISLEGQGRLREAIDAYITATKTNPKDARALNLFEKLLNKHPELKDEYNESLIECQNIVEKAFQNYEKPKQLH